MMWPTLRMMRANNLEKGGCDHGKCAAGREELRTENVTSTFIRNSMDVFRTFLILLPLLCVNSLLIFPAMNRVLYSLLETLCRLCTVTLLWSDGGGGRGGGA